MSSTRFGLVTQQLTAKNADLDVRNLPFGKPEKVVVHNEDNNYTAFWMKGMADGEAFVISDVGAKSLVTSNGFTMLAGSSTESPGFRLGALANINDTTTEKLFVEAYG